MVQFYQYLPTNQNYGRKHPDQTKHLQVIKGGRGASCNETYFQFQLKIYRKFQVTPHQSCNQTFYSRNCGKMSLLSIPSTKVEITRA